jgi:hypothetical protein
LHHQQACGLYLAPGLVAASVAAAALFLQDTELLVTAGANQLPIAQTWQQQQQVRAEQPPAFTLTMGACRRSRMHSF